MDRMVQFGAFLISIFLCWLFVSRRLAHPGFLNRLMMVLTCLLSILLSLSLITEKLGLLVLGDGIYQQIDIAVFACSAIAVIVSFDDVLDETRKNHDK